MQESSRKKILHITPHLGGGVGRVLLNYLSKVKDDPKFVHTVICLDYANQHAITVSREINLQLLDNMSKKKTELLEAINNSDAVLIHWWNHPLLFEFLVCEELPANRLILWSHISGFHSPNIFTEKLLKYPEIFVFTTPLSYKTKEVKNLPEKYKKNLKAVWSTGGVEDYRFFTPKEHVGFNIGYIGTVDYAKMHPEFLKICNKVKIPDVKFIICGGPKEKELKREAEILGIDDKFVFTGMVQDIREYLSIFDVFGYPLASYHYGTCDQVLQASMAAGIVPVVFSNSMEDYMVEDKITGIVADTIEDYIKGLEEIYHNHELREFLSKNAKKHANETFKLEKMVKKWENIFNEILVLPKTVKKWEIALEKSDITPKDIFLESLGDYGESFYSYCNAQDEKEKFAAIERIKKLKEFTSWQSKTKGTVDHYYQFFPDDPYLSEWSKLIYINSKIIKSE